MNIEIKSASMAVAIALVVSSCTKPDDGVVSTAPAAPTAVQTTNETFAQQSSVSDKSSEDSILASVASAPQLLTESRAKMNAKSPRMIGLSSVSVSRDARLRPAPVNNERYMSVEENGVVRVAESPVSTFSIDVDTASYSNIRRMLTREGRLPPRAAVRIEEMVNYFSYSYPQPASTDQPFSVSTEVAPAPWDESRHILRIGLKGYAPNPAERPDANLVFLVDVSGSMQAAEKLPMVKSALRMLVNHMGVDDRIALVVYAGGAGIVLDSTPLKERAAILRAIDNLQSGGSTHGSAGIKLAYGVAEEHFIKDGINRVLIASDGDMNVGVVGLEALVELIESKRKSGIALTTLGFGTGNFNDALMEQLADAGNGTASYIDNLKEAQKVLVSELQSTLLTIAKDVKIQVEFNPAMVQEYRLIGYENRMLAREDFANDRVDAGDIGAGHTVTALYEIVLQGSVNPAIAPLRYSEDDQGSVQQPHSSELAYVKLRYKKPQGNATSLLIEQSVIKESVLTDFALASNDFRFATAVAGFGQYLRGSKYVSSPLVVEGSDATAAPVLSDTLDILRAARGSDKNGYRSEFISLVELTTGLTAKSDVGG